MQLKVVSTNKIKKSLMFYFSLHNTMHARTVEVWILMQSFHERHAKSLGSGIFVFRDFSQTLATSESRMRNLRLRSLPSPICLICRFVPQSFHSHRHRPDVHTGTDVGVWSLLVQRGDDGGRIHLHRPQQPAGCPGLHHALRAV